MAFLDTFDRADGPIGSPWSVDVGSFAVTSSEAAYAGAYLLPDGRPIHLPEAGMHPNCLVIATPEGFMLAHPDDIIIRGVQGEFYPCKPEIFTQTYDPVGGGSDG